MDEPEDNPLRGLIEHISKHQMDEAFWASEYDRRLAELTKNCRDAPRAIGRVIVYHISDEIREVIQSNALKGDEIEQLALYIASELAVYAQLIKERIAAPPVEG